MRFSTLATAGAVVASASAQTPAYLGFNSGSTKVDRSVKVKADFLEEFNAAQKLKGAPGTFNSVRLYTNIQGGTTDSPIEAFDAAIETNTKILLGVWASDTPNINAELSALKKGLEKHGDKLVNLVIGISIGSEDLYRNSVTGIINKSGIGADPMTIVGFINDYRNAFKDTKLAKVPVGHVDTWDVYPNATNKAVVDACDWVGVDEYPYYENGKGNDIKNSPALFDRAYDAAVAAVGGKPVWLTETGFPVTGPNWDQAVPSKENAKYYWDNIGCRRLFNKVPTFWYTLRDSNPDNEAKFAITKDLTSAEPHFNLTCPTTFDVPAQGSTGGSGSTNSTGGGSGQGSSSGSGGNSTGSGNTGSGAGNNSGSGSTGGNSTSPGGANATPTPVRPSSAAHMIPTAVYAGVAMIAGLVYLL